MDKIQFRLPREVGEQQGEEQKPMQMYTYFLCSTVAVDARLVLLLRSIQRIAELRQRLRPESCMYTDVLDGEYLATHPLHPCRQR